MHQVLFVFLISSPGGSFWQPSPQEGTQCPSSLPVILSFEFKAQETLTINDIVSDTNYTRLQPLWQPIYVKSLQAQWLWLGGRPISILTSVHLVSSLVSLHCLTSQHQGCHQTASTTTILCTPPQDSIHYSNRQYQVYYYRGIPQITERYGSNCNEVARVPLLQSTPCQTVAPIGTLRPTWEFQFCLTSCILASCSTKWIQNVRGTAIHPTVWPPTQPPAATIIVELQS